VRGSRDARAIRCGLAHGLAGLLVLAAVPTRAEEVDCLIEPQHEVTVAAAIEGVVAEVLVDRGDVVTKGQVLARLESSVEEAAVAAARTRTRAQGALESSQARLEFAELMLQRRSSLFARNAGSKSDVDEAVSARNVAEAELKAAREAQLLARADLREAQAALERKTIRSPVDGIVVERLLAPGEFADPPDILRLAQVDPLRVETHAPLTLLGRIRKGATAEVMPEAPVGGTHAAVVTVVDPVVDGASGTFRVRLQLPNPESAIPAGLSCRVRFARDGDGKADSGTPPLAAGGPPHASRPLR